MKKKSLLILFAIILSIGLIFGVNKLKSSLVNNNTSTLASSVQDNKQNTENKKEIKNKKELKNEPKDKSKAEVKQEIVKNKKLEYNNIQKGNNVNTNKSKKINSSTAETKSVNNIAPKTKPQNTKTKETNKSTVNNPTQKISQKPVTKTVPKIEKSNFIIKNGITGDIVLSKYIDYNGKTVGNITIETLNRFNIPWQAIGTGSTLYIKAIKGLKERANGPLSGWCYYVNGKKPSVGCGTKSIKKGDKVEWKYLKDGINF